MVRDRDGDRIVVVLGRTPGAGVRRFVLLSMHDARTDHRMELARMKHAAEVVAEVKTIFSQPTREAAAQAVEHALRVLEPRFPKVAEQLRAAEADVLAYMSFPPDHWRSISSTNAIERLNAEIDRGARVVGIFPNSASLLRLTTCADEPGSAILMPATNAVRLR